MATEFDPTDPNVGVEVWEYTGRGKLYYHRFIGKYGETKQVPVEGGRRFHITAAERHYNQDLVKNPLNDPFENGTCIRIAYAEDTPDEDRQRIDSNPAMLEDRDIVALFKGRDIDKLVTRLEEISSPIVVERMLRIAEESDLPPSRTNAVRSRLAELTGQDDAEPILVPGANEKTNPEIYGDLDGPRVVTVGE